jgi:hypothetical protein
MSMLNVHGVMPASASVTGGTAAITTSAQVHGPMSATLYWLGITLLVLTALFALAAIRGLLPSRRNAAPPAPRHRASR